MNQSAETAQQPDRSVGELVQELSEQVTTLVRDELRLAQLEMARKGKQAGLGVGMLGGAGLTALYGVGCLIACTILAISGAIAAWAAALIVGVALLAAAGIAALLGKRRLQQATPPVPEEAAASVKADVETIMDRAHR